MLKRESLASMFARAGISKGEPSVAAVHVPTATWKKPARTRRQLLADAVKKAAGADAGTYIGRQVLNEAQLRTWWATAKKLGEPDLDANAHVTVAFSADAFDWTADPGHIVVQPSQFVGFKVLGKDKAVVLRLASPALDSRWGDTRRSGAQWSYPQYEPHVTLFYLGAGYDSTDWRDGTDQWPTPPDFPLVLGPELVGPCTGDVYETWQQAQAPSWYVPPVGA